MVCTVDCLSMIHDLEYFQLSLDKFSDDLKPDQREQSKKEYGDYD